MKKVIGYARVSSESQIENTSIKEQVERIRAYCKAQDWELVKIFKDEGVSASTTNRKGYQEMLQYTKDHPEINSFIVLKMDRVHRNQLNLLQFIKKELSDMEIDFVSITESFDTSTSVGRMTLGILSTFGEFERELINERTRGGRVSTAKDQKYAGGQVPFGYAVSDAGTIHIEEAAADIVKRIYEQYIDGRSTYWIAKTLNQDKIKTKHGGTWSPSQVRSVLTTETYTGFNKYDGKKEKNNIKQKDVFPAIVSRQKWNKVQKARAGS
jgi:site-specific DNA recombinase